MYVRLGPRFHVFPAAFSRAMPALVRSLTSARISFIEVFRRNSEFSSPVALGHSSVTNFTERHYAKWNKAQQDLLDNDLSGAWGKKR